MAAAVVAEVAIGKVWETTGQWKGGGSSGKVVGNGRDNEPGCWLHCQQFIGSRTVGFCGLDEPKDS